MIYLSLGEGKIDALKRIEVSWESRSLWSIPNNIG